MSVFEDYGTTSNNYDTSRRPLGAEMIAAMCQFYCNKQLKDIHLLDAGCGTGNYSKELIRLGVGALTLTDASDGMLNQCRKKLADAVANKTVTEITKNKLPKLPYSDKSFDAVLFSLVLHHLKPGDESDTGKQFAELEETIAEAQRVLKPKGCLIIIAHTHDDLYNHLYYKLNPAITEKYLEKFAPVSTYQEIFDKTGFKCEQTVRLTGTLMADHFNLDGPFDKSWRNCDSLWAAGT